MLFTEDGNMNVIASTGLTVHVYTLRMNNKASVKREDINDMYTDTNSAEVISILTTDSESRCCR